MKTAVIMTGGKQYVVAEGDRISIERRTDKEYKEGDTISFDEVLLVDDGKKAVLGDPIIKGSSVTGKVAEAGRLKKINVSKFKNKTRYHKVKGHRQHFLKVVIEGIA